MSKGITLRRVYVVLAAGLTTETGRSLGSLPWLAQAPGTGTGIVTGKFKKN